MANKYSFNDEHGKFRNIIASGDHLVPVFFSRKTEANDNTEVKLSNGDFMRPTAPIVCC